MRRQALGWSIRVCARPSVVFAAAALVRLALWAAVGSSDPFVGDDQQDYLAIRSDLVLHGAFLDPTTGHPTAYRDPGYPLLLSGLAMLGMKDVRFVFLLQLLLASVTGAMLVWFSRQVWGDKQAGLTGLLYILHLSLAPYVLFVYPEVLTCTLLVALGAALHYWVRKRSTSAQFLVGSLAAAVLLTRFASSVGILLWLSITIIMTGRLRSRSWLWMATIPSVLVLVWCWRNYQAVRVFAPNTSGAVNVYLGNNLVPERQRGNSTEMLNEVWEPLRGLSEAERAHRSLLLAGAFVISHPGIAMRRLLGKIPSALEFDRMFIGVARRGQFPTKPERYLLILGAVISLVSAIPYVLGLAAVLRPRLDWTWAAPASLFLGILLVQLITVAHSRYSMPAWLVTLPCAGAYTARFSWRDRADRLSIVVASAILAVAWTREILQQ